MPPGVFYWNKVPQCYRHTYNITKTYCDVNKKNIYCAQNMQNKLKLHSKTIKYYSKLRNKCLELLYELPNIDFDNTKIIFFNDIIFKYEDIINLLATNNEDYDAVCGLDFFNYFYDSWVAIDLDGNSLRHYFPFFIKIALN